MNDKIDKSFKSESNDNSRLMKIINEKKQKFEAKKQQEKQKELELLQQFPYEKGQLVYVEVNKEGKWISKFDKILENRFRDTDSFSFRNNMQYRNEGFLCFINEITTHRLATIEDLNRLPDWHKWKPKKLPTTIEEVCDVLKPSWYLAFTTNEILKGPASPSSSSTQQNAERVRSYNNLLNVIEWGNREWPEDIQHIAVKGLPNMSERTFKHISEYFYNDLKTFQS